MKRWHCSNWASETGQPASRVTGSDDNIRASMQNCTHLSGRSTCVVCNVHDRHAHALLQHHSQITGAVHSLQGLDMPTLVQLQSCYTFIADSSSQ